MVAPPQPGWRRHSSGQPAKQTLWVGDTCRPERRCPAATGPQLWRMVSRQVECPPGGGDARGRCDGADAGPLSVAVADQCPELLH